MQIHFFKSLSNIFHLFNSISNSKNVSFCIIWNNIYVHSHMLHWTQSVVSFPRLIIFALGEVMLFACQKGFPFFSKQSCSELKCCLWRWMVLAKEKSNVKMFLKLQSICKLLNLIRVKVKCYDLKIFWVVFLNTLFENRRNKMEENLKSLRKILRKLVILKECALWQT